jgi:hypothetical protein
MMSASAAAAAAAGSGAEVFPPYCGGDKTIERYVNPGIDFIDLLEMRPTAAELDIYDLAQEDLDAEYRASRDAVLKEQQDNVKAEWEGRFTDIENIAEYAQPTVFNRGILRETKSTWWMPLTAYEEWTIPDGTTGLTAAEVLPGISEVTVRPAVELKADLPTSGKTGEIIVVTDDPTVEFNRWYAWDAIQNEFNDVFYDRYLEPTLSKRRAQRDLAIKAKNEFMLAMSPFLWASYYIPDYRIVKDKLF